MVNLVCTSKKGSHGILIVCALRLHEITGQGGIVHYKSPAFISPFILPLSKCM